MRGGRAASAEPVTISAVICETILVSCSPPSADLAVRQWMLVTWRNTKTVVVCSCCLKTLGRVELLLK